MKEDVNALNCGRENDLIAFLYGELNDHESRAFQGHMHDCPACGHEIDGLKDVRESVVAWRDESLGGAIAREAIIATRATVMRERKPSASAALREFFTLSPMWMKGALAFATLLFCLFAGLAVARWRDVPPATLVTNVNYSEASEQKLNALVEQRVQEEVQRRTNGTTPTPAPVIAGDSTLQRSPNRSIKRVNQLANNVNEQKARRPLSSVERAQLASDLRLVSQANESELDLLDDGINK